MNITKVLVPGNIRYVSEWSDFDLFRLPGQCIINKVIPGCGMTEYAISCPRDIILCSPRKILLNNKFKQHQGDVYLFKNDYEYDLAVDKDIDSQKSKARAKIIYSSVPKGELFGYGGYKVVIDGMVFDLSDNTSSLSLYQYLQIPVNSYGQIDKKTFTILKKSLYQSPVNFGKTDVLCRNNFYETKWKEMSDYVDSRVKSGLPVKILVTYDSFHLVKDILSSHGIFNNFGVVVDEFQALMTDARFKANTEISFLEELIDPNNQPYGVYFVSATPMMEQYLDAIPEFQSLPYFELDWKTLNRSRVKVPNLKVIPLRGRSVNSIIKEIINDYRSGNFPTTQIDLVPYQSKEAIFYVNSINHIARAIKSSGLSPNEVNILCADTPENSKKIKRICGSQFDIGSVPLRNEPRKMFTFCTRTVYLGADFYSDNAKSFIFSDSRVETMSVDISLDLPQILGRQRLDSNPWRNSAEFYFRIGVNSVNKEEFEKLIENKIKNTTVHLGVFNRSYPEERMVLAEGYEDMVTFNNYRKNYVSVNRRSGSLPTVKLNDLVLVAERRAFDIQQVDYKDRFSVFSAVSNQFNGQLVIANQDEIDVFLNEYYKRNTTGYRLLYITETNKSDEFLKNIADNFLEDSDEIKSFIRVLGPAKVKNCHGHVKSCRELLAAKSINTGNTMKELIQLEFTQGEVITRSEVKARLLKVYSDNSIDKSTTTASDILKYFEVEESTSSIVDPGTGQKKRVRVFKIGRPK